MHKNTSTKLSFIVSVKRFYAINCMLLYQVCSNILHLIEIDSQNLFSDVTSLSHLYECTLCLSFFACIIFSQLVIFDFLSLIRSFYSIFTGYCRFNHYYLRCCRRPYHYIRSSCVFSMPLLV